MADRRAYYNEIDPFAAAWLRNLIAAGHIAAGDVDERSIVDVHPDDLRGYVQCHFFAGIGGWSYALRIAGWPDDRPVWTGSCPCQPFSAAGKQKGKADERHLWPEFRRLIAECNPATVFGEQVASKLGRDWLAGVRSDLEALGYAVGAADLCAAGVGAPHIRQRLWWVADAGASGRRALQWARRADGRPEVEPDGYGNPRQLAHALGARLEGRSGVDGELRAERQRAAVERGGEAGGVADAAGARRERAFVDTEGEARDETRLLMLGADRATGELAHPDGGLAGHRDLQSGRQHGQQPQNSGAGRMADTLRPGWAEGRPRPGIGSSAWSGGTLIPCADGKARRVGPGVFPLAHGVPARVGRLRGYGNAIVPQVAAEFIRAVMDVNG
jgi:DNA (cytosine-5)-methyltransferase 1